ncbi:LIMR family protein At5g01460-like isoform X2 [Papaver somniferum]|nr:LIMR family protein At5g01460-like isoform X2 [Papaver somniferum]
MKQGTGICVFKKLGEKAKELKKAADALQQEEKNGAKGRNWRQNVKVVEKVSREDTFFNCVACCFNKDHVYCLLQTK